MTNEPVYWSRILKQVALCARAVIVGTLKGGHRSTIEPNQALENGGHFAILLAGAILSLVGGTLNGQTSLSLGSTPGYPGTSASVPVRVYQATNITAAQFDFTFDTARATTSGPIPNPQNPGHTVRSREIAPGVHRTVVYSKRNRLLRTNGIAAIIPFYIPFDERIGSGPIVPSKAILASRDGAILAPGVLNSGSVFVQFVNRLPNGTIQFFLPSDPDNHYLIQATTNFIQWVDLTTTLSTGDFMDIIDTDAVSYPFRFYRSDKLDDSIRIRALDVSSEHLVVVELAGLKNTSYLLQASDDLRTWLDITTLTNNGGIAAVTNRISQTSGTRFFRLRTSP